MNWKILRHENYLEDVYLGERQYSEISRFLVEVKKEALNNGHKNILFDASNAKGNYDDEERVKIAEEIKDFFRYGYKIAAFELKEHINRIMEKTLLENSINFLVLADKNKLQDWIQMQ